MGALLCLLVSLLVTPPLLAAESPPREPAEGTYVTPPDFPTHVRVGLILHALDEVDPPSSASPRFLATYLLTVRWSDPRLAFSPGDLGVTRHVYQGPEAATELRTIFWPDVTFENEDGDRHVEGRTLAIDHDGQVSYEELFTSRFRTHFDLRRFPFDEQDFTVVVQPMSWTMESVVLEPIDDHVAVHEGAASSNLEWSPDGMSVTAAPRSFAAAEEPHARLLFSVAAARLPGFYLWKLIVPLLLIVTFTWTTFWMTGEAAGTRMQRAFIALLSVVAFHRVISEHLPHISALTFMDAMVYLSFAFIGATMVQIVLTHRAEHGGDKARAAKIDMWSRVAFPLGFFAALGVLWLVYHG